MTVNKTPYSSTNINGGKTSGGKKVSKMRTSYNLLFTLLILLASLNGCKKQKHYPADSNVGANVFGCYIDGQLFIPCNSFQWSIKSIVQSGDLAQFPSANVEAQNKCDKKLLYGRDVTFYMDSVNLEENKTYKLGNQNQRGGLSIVYRDEMNWFTSDSSLPGTITIRKFDATRKILSANFEATVWSSDSTHTKTLTKGTFDITFR